MELDVLVGDKCKGGLRWKSLGYPSSPLVYNPSPRSLPSLLFSSCLPLYDQITIICVDWSIELESKSTGAPFLPYLAPFVIVAFPHLHPHSHLPSHLDLTSTQLDLT